MTIRHYIKPGYLTPLAALCLALQLSGCGGLDDEASATATVTGPGSVTISWTAPASREDLKVLPLEEIGGIRVYYGAASGDYLRDVDIKSDGTIANGVVTVDGLPTGRAYYFVVTTYDTEGRESLYSPELEITI